MKIKMFFPVLLLAVASASWASAPRAEIQMKSLSYEPRRLEITQGQSVVWKNVALTEHSATADGAKAAFDTGMIEPEKSSKPVRFDKVGEFSYHCSLHGKTMSGIVVVKPAAAPGGLK